MLKLCPFWVPLPWLSGCNVSLFFLNWKSAGHIVFIYNSRTQKTRDQKIARSQQSEPHSKTSFKTIKEGWWWGLTTKVVSWLPTHTMTYTQMYSQIYVHTHIHTHRIPLHLYTNNSPGQSWGPPPMAHHHKSSLALTSYKCQYLLKYLNYRFVPLHPAKNFCFAYC